MVTNCKHQTREEALMTRSRNERINSLCLTLFELKRPWQRNWSFCWYRLTLSGEVDLGNFTIDLVYCFVVISWVVSLLTRDNPKTTMNPHELSRLTGNDCIVFFLSFFFKDSSWQLASLHMENGEHKRHYVGCRPAPGGSDQYFAFNPVAAAKSPFTRRTGNLCLFGLS